MDELTIHIHPNASSPFRAFDSYAKREFHIPFTSLGRAKQLRLTPRVARIHTLAINHWQVYRGYGLLAPCPWLINNTIFNADENGWSFLRDHGSVITIADWTDGVSEREYVGIPVPWGVSVLAQHEPVIRWLRTQKLGLAHVVKTVYSIRKNTYEEPVEHEEYQLIGLNPIITH